MLLVKTKNSAYRVTAHGDKFLVEKVSAENPTSTHLDVGESRVSAYVDMQIGRGMRFSDVHTSAIIGVTEE